jgi:uncharacterized membrane protein
MEHSGHHEATSQTGPQDEAEKLLGILRRRYALGEITQAQLEEAKAALGLEGGTPAKDPNGH